MMCEISLLSFRRLIPLESFVVLSKVACLRILTSLTQKQFNQWGVAICLFD